jgi:hypothetical protein
MMPLLQQTDVLPENEMFTYQILAEVQNEDPGV